jgi:hypothetical protein
MHLVLFIFMNQFVFVLCWPIYMSTSLAQDSNESTDMTQFGTYRLWVPPSGKRICESQKLHFLAQINIVENDVAIRPQLHVETRPYYHNNIPCLTRTLCVPIRIRQQPMAKRCASVVNIAKRSSLFQNVLITAICENIINSLLKFLMYQSSWWHVNNSPVWIA